MLPHVGRTNIAVPSLSKEVHVLLKQIVSRPLKVCCQPIVFFYYSSSFSEKLYVIKLSFLVSVCLSKMCKLYNKADRSKRIQGALIEEF